MFCILLWGLWLLFFTVAAWEACFDVIQKRLSHIIFWFSRSLLNKALRIWSLIILIHIICHIVIMIDVGLILFGVIGFVEGGSHTCGLLFFLYLVLILHQIPLLVLFNDIDLLLVEYLSSIFVICDWGWHHTSKTISRINWWLFSFLE